ncbi:hypothetical protein ACFL1E_04730 [Candidatus Omnitrophota bacterium]
MYKFSTIRNKKNALSLVEAMVTIVILSTSLILIVRSFSACLRAIQITKGYAIAELLLEEKMWEIKLLEPLAEEILEDGQFPEPYESFAYTIETSDVENSLEPEALAELVLTVHWQERSRNNNISVVTYVQRIPEQ